MYPRFLGRILHAVMSSPTRMAVCLTAFFLTTYLCLFFIPVRNVVFRYYIHKAWTNVSTPDLVHMHYIRASYPPSVYTKVACDRKRIPSFRRQDIDASRIIVPKASQDTGLVFDALTKGHGRYLPFMDTEKKLDYLYLFRTMRDSLQQRNILIFMTAGSILGATRHGGFVPWDDDLDFGIHIDHLEEVKQLLSCIQGFHLEIFAPHHWKFRFENQEFPFIDLFFYSRHNHYLWALTHYISHTFIYPEEMVFPLVEIEFEGMKMPMPGKGLQIASRIYDFSQCVAYQSHVKVNRSWTDVYPNGYSKTEVPCRDLLYMYNMANLDCDCAMDERS